MHLRQLFLQSKDLIGFQTGNFLYAIWLSLAIHRVPDFPWQELLILEAIAWISTAPFYTQSAAIGALPEKEFLFYSRLASAIKAAIAGIVFCIWISNKQPEVDLMLVGFLCLLGPVLLPQWTLFSNGFSRYAMALAICRAMFISFVEMEVSVKGLVLAAYTLQHVLPSIVVLLTRRGVSGQEAVKFSLQDGIYTSITYSCRYVLIATLSAALISLSSVALLPLIALGDRMIRPLFAAATPYLLRHSGVLSKAILRAGILFMALIAVVLGLIAALAVNPIPPAYLALLLLEAIGAIYFIGVHMYRSKGWAMLASGLFCMLAAMLLVGKTASLVPLAIIGATLAHMILLASEITEKDSRGANCVQERH